MKIKVGKADEGYDLSCPKLEIWFNVYAYLAKYR